MSTTTPPPSTTTTTTTAPHRSRTLLYAIIIIILIVVGVGVYYLTTSTMTTTKTNISIVDDGACAPNATACAFQPANYTTTVNNTTNWTNNGKVSHTVASCDAGTTAGSTACPNVDAAGLDTFSSPTISSGAPYSHTFAKAGTYYYYCTIHTWMHGTVTVH